MNKITFPLKSSMAGPDVANLQDALQHLLFHGGITIEDPTRVQEYSRALLADRAKQTFGLATYKLVRLFQAQLGLTVNGEVDQATASAFNVQLGLEEGELRIYQVEGRVSVASSVSVGGLRVVIVDKGVGGDVSLVETTTDLAGVYVATFASDKFQARGKTQPDLQARVFKAQTLLGTSAVRYNAGEQVTLDIVLEDKAGATLRSEHEVLTADLGTHVKGKLADLQETDEQQDITYLANKTGWDARAVALAALSDQFSARTAAGKAAAAIPQEFFYALFRAGLPANEEVLYLTETSTLETVWKRAAEQGVISKAAVAQIPAMVQRFQAASVQKLLSGPARVGASSFKEMLAVSKLNDAQQATFAQLYTTHRSDPDALWKGAEAALGEATAKRMQTDGKLAYLTLNNAPLMQKMHTEAGPTGLSDPVQLAQAGYYRPEPWAQLLTDDVVLPQEIPGETPADKRANYASYMAAQVRLSYPTAAVAHMVESGDLPLPGAPAGAAHQVRDFLNAHQGKFEIGVQPVDQYLAQNNIQAAPETVQQVKRLQRVYQLTPSDQAMTGLMKRGIDAAYHVARYDRDTFVQNFAQDLGGEEQAGHTHDRSVQIHGTVLNIALSYLHARTAPALGGASDELILDPQPGTDVPANAGDVLAYPTLEKLFGEMDYCACEHCRSILSPAAYLVDLLTFLDQPDPPSGTQNPQAVLLERRPDLQHLPLTCENTHTALPYIDVVNETLEYFVANSSPTLSLNGYKGHDTGATASEDLMASPQFVVDKAYQLLGNETFPGPLPFHRPLESLRRYFDKFTAPLPLTMERLRKTDEFERGSNPYGWRDILMEELRLSRAEYQILTDATAVPLTRMYGATAGSPEPALLATLSNARAYCHRVGINYEELVAILKTRFVNPNSILIPRLERLGVSFVTLQAFKAGQISDVDFDKLLEAQAVPANPAEYGGDIKAWVRNEANFKRIMSLIVLVEPSDKPDPHSFDKVELRYSKPMANPTDVSTRLGAADFVRLLRFIRLWKKLGWTIEQTDAAICALYRSDFGALTAADVGTASALDAGFLGLLPRLGVVVRALKTLGLTVERDLLSLLTCWADIGTHGETALYRQMFLNPAVLRQDPAFADNGYGEVLGNTTVKLADHAAALRSAFNLSGDEYARIVAALGFGANTLLTLANISAIYRRGWLARTLELSVRELLLLLSLTGLNLFGPFDNTNRFDRVVPLLIACVHTLKHSGLGTAAALYLIWNQDLGGKSSLAPDQVAAFARTLRAGLAAVEVEFTVVDDPGGDIAQVQFAKVYGAEAAAFFFGLLGDTLTIEVDYDDSAGTLTPGTVRRAIEAAAGKTEAGTSRIRYDDFRKRLTYVGQLTAATRDALKAAAGTTATAFHAAVDALDAQTQAVVDPFFARYAELLPAFEAYMADPRPATQRRRALLDAILPGLIVRRKRQQAVQAVSAMATMDAALAQLLLDSATRPHPLHAINAPNRPGLDDLIAIETTGLSLTGVVLEEPSPTPVPIPGPVPTELRAGAPGAAIGAAAAGPRSGTWRGYLEAPESGFFNLYVLSTAEATITLELDGTKVELTRSGLAWRNAEPLQFQAGRLYALSLKTENGDGLPRLEWEWDPKGQGRSMIAQRYLYPHMQFATFTTMLGRFFKCASLAAGLGLTANEMTWLAAHADYRIQDAGWLNALAVSGTMAPGIAEALLKPLLGLLDFARIKTAISSGDESLLQVLQAPLAATANEDSLLFTLTRWTRTDLSVVLTHFGGGIPGRNQFGKLSSFELFRRVYDAVTLVRATGIPAQALLGATTNEPTGDTVRDLQAALRARYEAADWRDVVRPINDEMRELQRDALVAYILHQMRQHPESAHIDTPNKLFEYFLMDVEMAACMQTSRVRHALSSVQLFIERCLMSLEPRVSPLAINARQWEWMKRYRVWEANRKVFLFPENWLEPELRDDKSPFFKELESELLQSDITDDRAASAIATYLTKLDEVAKLEVCGLEHIPADTEKRTGEVTHVIARTSGANRKYFYRRREYGYWTAWEQIKLDIEDNPIVPVVWNDRLFLFWLRVVQVPPASASNRQPFASAGPIISLSTTAINLSPSHPQVNAILCWSEYVNNTWQPTRTSDPSVPMSLFGFPTAEINRKKWRLRSAIQPDGSLHVVPSGYPILGWISSSHPAFKLQNGHSSPQLTTHTDGMSQRFFRTQADRLEVVHQYGPGQMVTIPLLNTTLAGDEALQPNHQFPMGARYVPFVYQDPRHAFFVSISYVYKYVYNYHAYTMPGTLPEAQTVNDLPILLHETSSRLPQPGTGTVAQPGFGLIDASRSDRIVSEDAYINRVIATPGTVSYGGNAIGVVGNRPDAPETQ